MPLRSTPDGFSLLEVVIASGLLLLTCSGVSGLVAASLRAEAHLRGRELLAAALDDEAARLDALPFAPGALPVVDASEAAPVGSLVAAVFPHADSARNNPDAYYCPDAGWGEPGTFVTTEQLPWGELRRTAAFVVQRGDEWLPIRQSRLTGWSLWAAAELPSAALRIELRATEASGGRAPLVRVAVIAALRPAVGASP